MDIMDFKVPKELDFLKMGVIDRVTSFGVADIEAYLNEKDEFIFKLGVVFDGSEFKTAYSVEEMFDIMHFSRTKRFYFHNLNFDFIFFLREHFLGLDVDIIQSGNMLLSVKVGQFTFLNSLSILPLGLKKVVNIFLGVHWEEWENEKNNVLGLDDDVLKTYCMRDCFLTYASVNKFDKMINENYGIKKYLTIPSLALKVFNKKFLEKEYQDEIFTLKNRENFFKEGYYFGGHTEKFVNYKYDFKNINYYDVNSLYPSVMKNLYVNLGGFEMINPTPQNLIKLIEREDNPIFYADIEIFVDCEDLRIFPSYDETKKSNFYKFGLNRVKISDITFKYIKEHGFLNRITRIHGILTPKSDKKIKIFNKFVTTNYALRKSDKEHDFIYKLFLNGLYGKYGQKTEQSQYVLNPTNKINSISMTNHGINFIHETIEDIKIYSLKYSRYDISGRITESARILMSNYRKLIKDKGGKIYYQDTDSLQGDFCLKCLGLDDIFCNKTLGKLKKENDGVGRLNGYIIGQKVYNFNHGFNASKGVKNMQGLEYIRLSLSLNKRNFLKGKIKFKKFVVCSDKNSLSLYPNNLFYNTRFTQTKTYLKKGFFGIQIVPHYITNIRERIDGLESYKSVEKLDKIFGYLFERYKRYN